MTSCILSASVQKLSSPKVSKRKVCLPWARSSLPGTGWVGPESSSEHPARTARLQQTSSNGRVKWGLFDRGGVMMPPQDQGGTQHGDTGSVCQYVTVIS